MSGVGIAAGFNANGSVTPDNLLAGEFPRVSRMVTITGHGVLTAGTVLGKQTTDGHYRVSEAALHDGSEQPDAILAEEVDLAHGDVLVTVLSTQGNGVPDAALLDCVEAALNDEWVRPLTDHVIVQAATIVNYRIAARLHFANGPDPTVVLQVAREALLAYTQRQHALGQAVPLSALYAVLHQPGVVDVSLESPTATMSVTATQAAFCESIVLSREDHDDA